MLRVILDTNVIVSGLISRSGPPAMIIHAWSGKRFQLLTSPSILQELGAVLNRPALSKYLKPEEVRRLYAEISQYAVMIEPAHPLPAIPIDPDDLKFLQCAFLGKCAFLVTGDKELLDLGRFHETRIVTPAQFWTHIK